MFTINVLVLSLYAMYICDAHRVLVVFPTPARSHLILSKEVVRHLLEAGNEVTYVTPYPKVLEPHPALREIDVSTLKKFLPEDYFSIDKIMKNEFDMRGLTTLIPLFHQIMVACLENDNVRDLLSDSEEEFDVLILEWMFSELISGISPVFNCPYIWFSTVDPHWMVLKLIDTIPNPSYTTSMVSNNEAPLSFFQRIEELLSMLLGLGTQRYMFRSEHKEYERLLAPIIRKRGHKVPDFEEVRYNASLILGNSHISTGQPLNLPQSYKAVGGYHINVTVAPLPEELKKILDNANNGLIYFSMGTIAKSKNMPAELKISLLKMFGKLQQTILWKFEEDLPNRPSNVHIIKWSPQQSILAHPNCVLFITHGGLLSTMEAVYYGKPIIGIPVFGDQFNNVDRYVKRGIARRVDLCYTMADDLEAAIHDMLNTTSYSTKMRTLSYINHHRSVLPAKEMVHWVDHVVNTKGALHLRSPALMVPWYQKCYLDLAFLLIIFYDATVIIVKLIISFSKKQKKKIH